MPISEDEHDSNQGYSQNSKNPPTMSKAELRKTNKPIMEKKRRARINQCLNELKDLILNAMKKDPARHSKLEKADILELTVKHLQTIQRQHLTVAAASDPQVAEKFRAGFGECAAEVRRFLSRRDTTPAPVARRLAAHLDTCVDGVNNMTQVPSIPLIPSRLPTGEFALVLPKNAFGQSTSYSNDLPGFLHKSNHASAFKSVQSTTRPVSPPASPTPSDSSCILSESEPESYQEVITMFPTPPSRTSNESTPETQKPTVSSTTISPDTKTTEKEPINYSIIPTIINNKIDESPKSAIEPGVGREYFKKRQIIVYSYKLDQEHSDEPPKKVTRIASDEVTSTEGTRQDQTPPSNRQECADAERQAVQSTSTKENMWRPW